MVDNAGGAVFDATQYEFFGGNDAVEEVELGGLEDEEDDVAPAGFEEEEFIFDGDQVASLVLIITRLCFPSLLSVGCGWG